MSKRPVLEEVDDDDIDNMDMDIAQFDPNLKTPVAPLQPGPSVVRSQDTVSPTNPPRADSNTPEFIRDPRQFTDEEKSEFRAYQVIYPCYFDKNRSHKQGRRINVHKAVENPLAKTVADACRFLRLPVLLELDKTHPQDYGNPGRVKVLIKRDGVPADTLIKNKRQIMNSIGTFMQLHPTTLDSVSAASGHPVPPEYKEDGYQPGTIPKVQGFKMNTIVPIHSPLTMKHPMTKHIYDAEPEQPKIAGAKVPKKKIMKIRG